MVMDREGKVSLLACDGFAAIATIEPTTRWSEFELVADGRSCGIIGGYSWPEFAKDVLAILRREQGRRLATIPNAAFVDVVGDLQAEYLGNVPLSGYNTFYFFRSTGGTIDIVLADCNGKAFAHTRCNFGMAEEWLKQLEALAFG